MKPSALGMSNIFTVNEKTYSHVHEGGTKLCKGKKNRNLYLADYSFFVTDSCFVLFGGLKPEETNHWQFNE